LFCRAKEVLKRRFTSSGTLKLTVATGELGRKPGRGVQALRHCLQNLQLFAHLFFPRFRSLSQRTILYDKTRSMCASYLGLPRTKRNWRMAALTRSGCSRWT
jgi:hypothetical protein